MPNLFEEIDRARAEAAARYERGQSTEPAPPKVKAHPLIGLLSLVMILSIPLAIILTLVGGADAQAFLKNSLIFIILGATYQVIRWGAALHILRPGLFGTADPTPRALALPSLIWLVAVSSALTGNITLFSVFLIGFGLLMVRTIHRTTLRVMAEREMMRLRSGAAPSERISD